MTYNRVPRTWADGSLVTAAQLNADLRDLSSGVQASWTTYTPTWASTTGADQPALGAGLLTGKYLQVGSTIHFRIALTIGAGTTFGVGQWRFSLPKPTISGRWNFATILVQAPSSNWTATSDVTNGTTARCSALGTTAGGPNRDITGTVPFAWSSGDQLYMTGTYETTDGVV